MNYRIKNIVLTVLVFTLFGGCTHNIPETLFEKDGVSFISPAGWKVSGERILDKSGYYVSTQRKGYSSSGIFILTWVNGKIDPSVYIESYRNEFEKNLLMRATKVQFSNPADTFFKSNPCVKITYTSDIMGVATRGEIYSFEIVDKTFMLVFQETVDESEKNKTGFEKIKKSFSYTAEKSLS